MMGAGRTTRREVSHEQRAARGLQVALVVATPKRFNRESRVVRTASLSLSGLVTLANGWSAVLLVLGLVNGQEGEDAGPLLSTGASIC